MNEIPKLAAVKHISQNGSAIILVVSKLIY